MTATTATTGSHHHPYYLLNTTLCKDKCQSDDCKTYMTPLDRCYNPFKLFPFDNSWSDFDIFDSVTTTTTSLNRTIFTTKNVSCTSQSDDDVNFIIPLQECVGPFGKPRPWGIFEIEIEIAARSSVSFRSLKKKTVGGGGSAGKGVSSSAANTGIIGTMFRGNDGTESSIIANYSESSSYYLIAVAVGATVVFVLMIVGVILLHFYRQRWRSVLCIGGTALC